MMRLKILIPLAVMLSAQAAYAEVCTFTQEGFEDEACLETQFEITIEGDTLVTVSETIPVTTGGSDTTSVFVGYSSSAFHVLTREKQGQARYSTHLFEGLLMLNYLGTCE